MFENPECSDCELHDKCNNRCLPSQGDQDCKLAIFLDYPSLIDDRRGRPWSDDRAQFVDWSLQRMGIDPCRVYRDYIVKCYPGKKGMPSKKEPRMACVRECAQYRFASLQELAHLKALVVLGSLGCEAMLLHKTVSDKEGAEWEPVSPLMRQHVAHVWVGYSPGVLGEQPAEAPGIFRVIWCAAKEAGLEPEITQIKPFDFKI